MAMKHPELDHTLTDEPRIARISSSY